MERGHNLLDAAQSHMNIRRRGAHAAIAFILDEPERTFLSSGKVHAANTHLQVLKG